jgi:hypothetical protein
MSDRAFSFLFSCAVILASLGATAWLVATGQAETVDGLFLLLMCLTIALAFGLYVMFMIRRAMESNHRLRNRQSSWLRAGRKKAPPCRGRRRSRRYGLQRATVSQSR